MELFSDPEVVEVFKRTKGRGVGADFLSGLAFVDTTVHKDDSPEIRKIKKDMARGVPLGYHAPSGTVFVDIDRVTPEFVKDGGLDHEVSHAKIERDYHGEFAQLEERFGFSRFGKSKNSEIEAIVESFEEVAAHVHTFNFRGRDEKYVEQVYEKYRIQQGDPESIQEFVDVQLADSKFIQIAEALASFDYLDLKTAGLIRESLSKYKGLGDLAEQNLDKIFKLVECFQSAHKLKKASFEKLQTLLGSMT
ncbi:MAG: hypothetical protein ABIE94_02325 [archaeon]